MHLLILHAPGAASLFAQKRRRSLSTQVRWSARPLGSLGPASAGPWVWVGGSNIQYQRLLRGREGCATRSTETEYGRRGQQLVVTSARPSRLPSRRVSRSKWHRNGGGNTNTTHYLLTLHTEYMLPRPHRVLAAAQAETIPMYVCKYSITTENS